MTSDERSKFNLQEDICYLNMAYMAPQLNSSRIAGTQMIEKLANPSGFVKEDFFEPPRELCELFAQLIGCNDPGRVAMIPSCSYGMANVAAQIKPSKGSNIIVAQGQFPSNYYIWEKLSNTYDCELRVVGLSDTSEQKGRSWNIRLLESIDRNTTVVSLAPLHWSDGTKFDLTSIRARTRECDALLILDGSQAIGAIPFSVEAIQPDALICAGYKWLLGPYGAGLGYYGEYFDNGVPIEENWIIRENSDDFRSLVNYNPYYREKAFRYSAGEHPAPIHVTMQIPALKQLLDWGPKSITNHAATLFAPFEDQFKALGCKLEEEEYRSKHLFGLRLPAHVDIEELKRLFESEGVFISLRGDAVRVSLHLFNNKADLERLLGSMRKVI